MPTMTKAGYVPPEPPKPPKSPKKKAPPGPTPKKKKHKMKRRMSGAAVASLIIFAAAALIGAGTLYVYAKTQPYQNTYLPGTMLMGYPMEGASQEDALALIGQVEENFLAPWQFELSCMNQTYTVHAQDVKLEIDSEATLAPLWEKGREGGMLSRFLAMMALAREPMAALPVLRYDLSFVDGLIERIRDDVACDPVDATVAFHPGSAQPFVFTDEETGYALDASGVKAQIEQALTRLAPGSMTLEPEVIEPAVYRAALENAITMRSRLVVPLSGSREGVHNAALAVAAMNGARIEPGETLSFNQTIGARTAAGGYMEAEEPAYGANAVGVGGGVCQAATLLYRAALEGGIEIAERNTAAYPVTYCGMGQEAAVSDQGLDLVIRNQTDTPLFVMARTYEDDGKTMAEMTLIGEELGVRYALESISRETGMIEEPVYVRDREGRYATYSDEHVPVGEALMGYISVVERVTLDRDGQETARETISENVYEAVPPMIYVGVTDR